MKAEIKELLNYQYKGLIMDAKIKELLDRQYNSGTRVINCFPHMHVDLTERPDDCKLCLADLRNQFSLAINMNQWLNEWKEDAIKILNS